MLSFLTGPMPQEHDASRIFTSRIRQALFFKRFMLISTMLTIGLGLDYAPVYERFIPSGDSASGLWASFSFCQFSLAPG